MKQHFKSRLLLALVISLAFISCNQGEEKKTEPPLTDSTATTKKEPSKPALPDAVTAAPGMYKVIADTLGMRMLEVTYKPGDSSAMHQHPVNAMYVVEGGTAEFVGMDGSKMTNELKAGMSAVRGIDMHSVKNVGKTTMKVILMECNRPATLITPDAATDPTKVAPDHYKTLNDSLGIRIVEVSYKPGQSSAFHTHPDCAAYVLQGGTGELTDKAGKKNVNEIKSGMAWISPADGHSGKNIGKTFYKLILFEVSRARN